MADVLAVRAGLCGLITLNRPAALNALTLPMVRDIRAALEHFNADSGIGQIVLVSADARAFCAGGDVRAATARREDPAAAAAFFRAEYELNHAIATSPKPVVAVVDGLCLGGGMGLSIHATHTLASERAVFAMPEMAIGLFPDVGAGFFLRSCSQGFARWFALTGLRLSAGQARAAGLVDHVLPADRLPHLLDELETEPVGVVLGALPKAGGAEDPDWPEMAGMFSEPDLAATITRLRASRLPAAAAALAAFERASPTSLLLAHAHLAACRHLALRDVLRRDYRLACGCLRGSDFYEGVRARLVDRDDAPRWQPATLAEVTADRLAAFLDPPFGPDLFDS